ncbi:Trypsin-like peptidase domain-containing protein [Actinomadura madurae]|uniref:Trypsin-like peptidase domain-containing protein n=1 Tax=Actinomadura madurae TaxID=1993 RepID=A0A1I5HLQ1_9ACTN|nr:serine protease [Actinomadura madurae]SFO48771.1 Trypsin-like peptidase domain-containing protein [Actinomadura madurae]
MGGIRRLGRLDVLVRGAAAVLAAGTLAGTGTAAAAAEAAPAPAPPEAPGTHRADVDFTGIVALSNCSGSLVRGPRSRDTDAALVLTNGHCLESGMPKAGEVVVDRRSSRTFTLLDPSGGRTLGSLRATKIEYATMTDTDVTVYRLDTTYAAIRRRYGVPALRLSTARPADGTPIRVVSGYWRTIYGCAIDATVYRLREAGWTWKDSIRYTPRCRTIHGTSGSPVIDVRTRDVVGVNNTGNDDGERCTFNNPCEVDRTGAVTVRHGSHYGQQTYLLARCLGAGNDVVLGGGCALPRP